MPVTLLLGGSAGRLLAVLQATG